MVNSRYMCCKKAYVLLQTRACVWVCTHICVSDWPLPAESAMTPFSSLPSLLPFIIIPSNHRFSLLLTPLSHRSSFLCCRESGVARFEIGLNDRQNACKHKQMFLKSYVLINTSTRPDKCNAHNKHPCKPRKHRTKDVCANRKVSCVIILCHIFLRRKVFQHLQVSCTFETVSWC